MGVQINGDTGNISATKADYSGNVTIGGTLTYEDVTNIDSVGLVTARSGIEIGARPGVAASISVDGNMIVSGISTLGDHLKFDTTGKGIIFGADGGSNRPSIIGNYTSSSNNNIVFNVTGSERLRIDSSGRLLLGTTTEGSAGADEFTINTASGHGGMTIRNDTSSNGNIWFSDGTSGAAEYAGYVQYAHNGDHMVFGTAGAERVRIDSSGRLLLGTTTEGNESADDLTLANSTNCGLSIRSGTSSNGSVFFTDATSGADEYRGFIQYQHSNDRLYFGTATTSKMYIEDTTDNGDVHVQTGNIVFDTAGKGIDFSAQTATSESGSSATSELLDHYEEGTWTPSFTDGNSGAAGYNQRHGWYTRIGNTVYVWFRLQAIDTSGLTGGNTAYITGLPFPIAQSTGRITTGHLEISNANVHGNCFGVSIFANTGSSANAYFRMFQMIDGAGHSPLSVGAFTDDDNEVNGEFFYVT